MNTEEWKDMPGYVGLYKVSSMGRIKSLARRVLYKNGRSHYQFEKIMRPVVNKRNGYVYIGLTDINKVQKLYRLHILVAKCFLLNPNQYPQVNHKDYNKQNNVCSNLEWCDGFHNQKHAAIKPGRKWQKHRLGKFGKLNPKSKPVLKIDPISNDTIGEYESACLAARENPNTHQTKISACCRGVRRSNGGYIWKFKN